MILNRSNDLSSDRALNIETVEYFSPFVSVDLAVLITLTGGEVYLRITTFLPLFGQKVDFCSLIRTLLPL